MNEKRQSINANVEINQILELSHKDFKPAIITMLQQPITDSLGKKENNRSF